eukprot:2192813-Amphidinium_carterae.4
MSTLLQTAGAVGQSTRPSGIGRITGGKTTSSHGSDQPPQAAAGVHLHAPEFVADQECHPLPIQLMVKPILQTMRRHMF